MRSSCPSTYVILIFALGCGACDGSTSPADAGATDGAGGDARDAGADADVDASEPPRVYRTCTAAELDADDHTQNGADVTFPLTAGPAQYSPHCIRIKVNQTVQWAGNFTEHPLAGNGEPGNPVPQVTTGTQSPRVSFPVPGTYGYRCTEHVSEMYGAVKVIP